MNGYNYILAKQTQWAKNKGLSLIGSKISRGRPMYSKELEQNLYQPLLPEVYDSFAKGDGGELGSSGLPGKMQALHSSSALGVNIFHYWKAIDAVPVIASACRLCRKGSQIPCDIRFEEKYPIKDSFGKHPNIDVVIHNRADAKIKRFAIECKFTEAYGGRRHGGLKAKYLESEDIWAGLSALRTFAESICPDDNKYMHLHPAQLIKHILGLNRQFGKEGFRLLYLWYDVLGAEGKRHRDETQKFTEVVRQDGIMFHSLTYQELIINLANHCRRDHEGYIQYLTERYL